MPLDEMKEYEDFHDLNMEMMIRTVGAKQAQFFPHAGLGHPTIPSGASARTLLRYQGAINSMITRCLTILERRRKERTVAGDAVDELTYQHEPTEVTAAATEPALPQSGTERAAPATKAEMHKRTQKPVAEVKVSRHAEPENKVEAPAAPRADTDRGAETA